MQIETAIELCKQIDAIRDAYRGWRGFHIYDYRVRLRELRRRWTKLPREQKIAVRVAIKLGA